MINGTAIRHGVWSRDSVARWHSDKEQLYSALGSRREQGYLVTGVRCRGSKRWQASTLCGDPWLNGLATSSRPKGLFLSSLYSSIVALCTMAVYSIFFFFFLAPTKHHQHFKFLPMEPHEPFANSIPS